MNKLVLRVCGIVAGLGLAACDGSGDSGNGGNGGDGGSGGAGGSGAGSTVTSSGGAGGNGGSGAGGSGAGGSGGSGAGGSGFAAEAVALCEVINDYREQQGLAKVPFSPALFTVAAAHVGDLGGHPEMLTADCNLHSWSEGSAEWTGCCYTADHAKAQCMWDKPRELTSDWGAEQYQGNGYEIAESGAGSPEQALELWKGSPGHHNVILNADIWTDLSPWPAMGCAFAGGYGVVWFGDQADPKVF